MAGNRAKHLLLSLVLLLAAGSLLLAPAAPAFAQAPPTQSDLDALKASAKSDRSFAADRLEKAKAWRAQAKQARKYAKESLDPRDRARWEKAAKGHDERAARLEAEAAKLLEAAKKTEAKAAKLEGTLSDQRQAEERAKKLREEQDKEAAEKAGAEKTEKPPYHLALWEAIGVWRNKDGDEPFVIVQQDPGSTAYPGRLEAHTRNRVWKGNYEPFEKGDIRAYEKSRLTFRYTPKAEEMNPEIPLWARRQMAGKLEWRIEIDEGGDEFEPLLKARWYPGEVHWRDEEDGEGRAAWVDGDGKPRRFELEPDDRIDMVALVVPVLTVKLPGDHDPFADPIEGLTKGQRFLIRVLLPPELAEKQGPKLTVSIKGLKGGGKDSIELEGHAPLAGRPVVYSHTDPVTIADENVQAEPDRRPQFLSLPWIFGVTGARLDLEVGNGEAVEFSFGEVSETIPVFDSWVQRAIARHRQGAKRLRGVYQSIILSGRIEKAKKAAAHKRVRMLANYEAMYASDRLTDLHRFHLGELYLRQSEERPGIATLSDKAIEARYAAYQAPRERRDGEAINFLNPKLKAYLEGLTGKDLSRKSWQATEGIVWTSDAEQALALAAIREAGNRIERSFLKRAVVAWTFGMYNGTVVVSPTGLLHLAYRGRDHFNRRVPYWQRVHAVVGLGSTALLPIASSRLAQAYLTRPSTRQLGTKGLEVSGAVGVRRGGQVRELGQAGSRQTLPASLKASQRDQTKLSLKPRDDAKQAVGCAAPASNTAKVAAAVDSPLGGQPFPMATPLEVAGRQLYVAKRYGEGAQLINPFSLNNFFTQSAGRPTCNLVAANWIIFKRLGSTISERVGMQRILMIMEDLFRRRRISSEILIGAGSRGKKGQGYANVVVRHYLRSFGAKVWEVPVGDNKVVKIRMIEGLLNRGYAVKAVLKFGKDAGKHAYHAVVVEKVVRNSKGRITHVEVFDPNVGGLVRVPALRFKRLLGASNPENGVVTAIRFGALGG